MWKPVACYEDLYEVSDAGYVRRKEPGNGTYPGRILKSWVAGDGRTYVALYDKGIRKKHLLNQLVAIAFVPNPDGYKFAKHRDGNKQNNHADNLVWSIYPSAIITKDDALRVRDLLTRNKRAKVARMLGIPYHIVREIDQGTTWKDAE